MSIENLRLILFILMIVVVVIELAYILLRRRRRKQEMFRRKSEPVETVADKAHNLILTTESISKKMSSQGVNTYEADVLLRQARTEETARDFSAAVERAEAAKLVLLRLKREHESSKSAPASTDPEKRPMNQSIYDTEDTPLTSDDAYTGRDRMLESVEKEEKDLDTLPTNYVQAKFMINTTKTQLDKQGITKGEAFDLYAKAQKHFDKEDYSQALSLAIKADQMLGSSVGLIAEEAHLTSEEIEVYVCPNCDNEVSEDDVFCRECGQNLEEAGGCPGCGEPIDANDKFCRKCGEKL